MFEDNGITIPFDLFIKDLDEIAFEPIVVADDYDEEFAQQLGIK